MFREKQTNGIDKGRRFVDGVFFIGRIRPFVENISSCLLSHLYLRLNITNTKTYVENKNTQNECDKIFFSGNALIVGIGGL